jgi:hypothetical protein
MKKSILLVLGVLGIFIFSCNNNEDDQSQYFDNDEDCINTQGNCCDVDGRILVNPNDTFIYTYEGSNNGVSNLTNIVWTVTSGSITIVGGQNTSKAKFKFGSDFTTGTIKAGSLVDGSFCENSLNITKI